MIRERGKCRINALLTIVQWSDGAIVHILPLCQFNRVAFRGDRTVEICRAGDIGLTVGDGNSNIEATAVVAGGAYALTAIDYDAVLF